MLYNIQVLPLTHFLFLWFYSMQQLKVVEQIENTCLLSSFRSAAVIQWWIRRPKKKEDYVP